MAGRNPNWTREELILALDLYVSSGRCALDDRNPDVVALSLLLRSLPIHASDSRMDDFRSPNGVSLKLQNLASVDHGVGGMPHGSRLEPILIAEFAADAPRLRGLAQTYRESVPEARTVAEPEESMSYPEGAYAYRIHRGRERNQRLIREKKQQAWRNGALACEVCGLRPEDLYPQNGERALECHHIIPLSSLSGIRRTRLDDLALVCASCHRVLHASNPPIVPIALAASLAASVSLERKGA